MKIKITQTIEIDTEKWANEYGLEIKDVRADIKKYFDVLCQEQIERLGMQKNQTK